MYFGDHPPPHFHAEYGEQFLFPGVGYGGSCFPKDVKALIRTMAELGAEPSILQAVDDLNDRQKGLLLRQVVERLGDDLEGATIAVWGLAQAASVTASSSPRTPTPPWTGPPPSSALSL